MLFILLLPSINHYQQRLQSLYFKKKFAERVAEVKPKIKGTLSKAKGGFTLNKKIKVGFGEEAYISNKR